MEDVTLSSLTADLVKIVVGAAVASGLAWLVGNRVGYRWDEIKRRRESDLAARDEFYRVYGKFFATWKLWNTHKKYPSVGAPDGVQWKLLEQAEEAEAGFEALLVKLASERPLCARDRRLLACFRQAYQSLRERLRENGPLEWWATGPPKHPEHEEGFRQYRTFKALSEYSATLLAEDVPPRWLQGPPPKPSEEEAIQALLDSTVNLEETWVEDAATQLPSVQATTGKRKPRSSEPA
jgi:hypothetical protein